MTTPILITAPPSPPPSRSDPANFAERGDAFHSWLGPAVAKMNDQHALNNTLHDEVITARDDLMAAGLANAEANALTATAQATAALGHANNAAASAGQAGASAVTAAGHATSAGAAGTAAAQVLIGAVTQRPALRPSLSVDWTLRPTAAALTAAGWTVSRAGEMTYFGPVPTKVAENLFVRSADFANASWVKTGLVAPAAVTDESGLVGSTVIAAAGAGQHALGELTTSTNFGSQTYRLRFLCKAATYTKAIIADRTTGRAAAAFDLAAGTTIASTFGAGYTSHAVEAHELGGGLYWCNLVMTSAAAGTNWEPTIIGYPDSGATLSATGASYTGDGTSGIEVYAAQLQHNFDGDYVPTTDVPITQYANPLLTAAANELAYQHNSRGECVGLLQYPSDTNLCLQSQALGTSPWASGGGCNVSATKRLWAGFAPFWRVAKAVSGTAALFQAVAIAPLAATTAYTATIAIMADRWSGCTTATVGIRNMTAASWPATSAVIISGPGAVSGSDVVNVTGLSTEVPTLIRITAQVPTGTAAISVTIYPQNNGVGTLGAAILATRVHLSASPRYMPYIPTTTAAVTREAQTITFGGSAFAAVNNPVEGTLLARASVEDLAWDNSRFILTVQQGTDVLGPNRVVMGTRDASAAVQAATVTYGAVAAQNTNIGSISTSAQTAAYSYAQNNFTPAFGGLVSVSDTSGLVPVVDRLRIGWNSGVDWPGLIQRTELYPRAMTSAELAAITTPGVLV